MGKLITGFITLPIIGVVLHFIITALLQHLSQKTRIKSME